MKPNIGQTDKTIRVILATVFAYLGYMTSPWFYLLTITLLIRAVTGYCGGYTLIGKNTMQMRDEAPETGKKKVMKK